MRPRVKSTGIDLSASTSDSELAERLIRRKCFHGAWLNYVAGSRGPKRSRSDASPWSGDLNAHTRFVVLERG